MVSFFYSNSNVCSVMYNFFLLTRSESEADCGSVFYFVWLRFGSWKCQDYFEYGSAAMFWFLQNVTGQISVVDPKLFVLNPDQNFKIFFLLYCNCHCFQFTGTCF
jgi:hypothetical protein